ncbi:MAG: regulatory protein GemA [Nitrospirota bacterium]|nr:regulatory protein GemA [Nitrospirota bacterium]
MGNWRERRRADLGRIHQARRSMDLDDPTYRALLRDLTGHDSAAELDANGLARVIAFFRECGALTSAPAPATPRSRPSHVGRLRAMWRGLAACGQVADGSPQALDRFVRHHIGCAGVAALNADQAARVTHLLKTWQRRRPGRRGRPNGRGH